MTWWHFQNQSAGPLGWTSQLWKCGKGAFLGGNFFEGGVFHSDLHSPRFWTLRNGDFLSHDMVLVLLFAHFVRLSHQPHVGFIWYAIAELTSLFYCRFKTSWKKVEFLLGLQLIFAVSYHLWASSLFQRFCSLKVGQVFSNSGVLAL